MNESLFSIEVLLSGVPLVSTNHAYFHGVKYLPGGKGNILRHGKPVRPTTYKTKNTVYLNMESEVNAEFNKQVTDEQRDTMNKLLEDSQNVVRLNLDFGFSTESYYLRDTSNYIKALEDAIKNCIGVDDTRNVELVVKKHPMGDIDWVTIIKIDVVKSEEILFRKWSGVILGGS